jgi:hypothetical protein
MPKKRLMLFMVLAVSLGQPVRQVLLEDRPLVPPNANALKRVQRPLQPGV